ncbi:CidA/LrgA family protein [uncultured Oscillibacter sp.]|uniref:CidA/LrgA family protein n=1 Tax=uncultured Oscillibacter sp. TaxID=876091 RepID=UPI0025F9FFCD|nr:CidA/LrgA family protein [uncultured Oscillibacter sp.]
MKILLQIGVVFGVYWVSQCIEAVLPFPFPASVISLLLLLLLLAAGLVKVDHVREKADFLLGNLGFFFVPVSVGIMNYVDVIRANAAAFLTVCVVSMVLTYGATVWAVRLTCRLLEKKRGGERA